MLNNNDKTIYYIKILNQIILIAALVFWVSDDSVAEQKNNEYESIIQKRIGEDSVAAEHGDAQAQYEVGRLYESGSEQGYAQNYLEAMKWYRMAANQGNSDAQYAIGGLYILGNGVAKDISKGIQWARKAANNGNARAQFELGTVYMTGEGGLISQDVIEGKRLLRELESNSSADSQMQFKLGMAYMLGDWGLKTDKSKAIELFLKSVAQGNAAAMTALGDSYRLGEGVIQNYQEAIYWYRKGSENYSTGSDWKLGMMYEIGVGLPQDFAEAVKLYTKSSDRYSTSAQYLLGRMYASGRGVPQDYVQAHMLFNIAGARGHDEAIESREETTVNR